jgi:hypothetical protein
MKSNLLKLKARIGKSNDNIERVRLAKGDTTEIKKSR